MGSYTITFDRYEVSDNYEKGFNEAVLAIEARSATVTARNQTITKGEAITDDVSMATLSGPAKGDTLCAVRLTARKEKIIPSGAKIANAAGVDVTGNYNITYVPGKLTVNPKPTPKPTKTPKPTARPTAAPTVKPTPKPTPKPADPDFTLLARMIASGSNKTTLKVVWTKVWNADGYDVYFARCGRRFKLKKTVSASKSRAVRFRSLDARRSYKAYVRAWKKVGGKKVHIGAASPQVHAIAGGYDAEYCNAKSVALNRSNLTLKVGRSKALKAIVKGVKRDRKVLRHVWKVRFYSTDAHVATVDKYGRVKGVGKGICTIYAVANDGARSGVKVKVK